MTKTAIYTLTEAGTKTAAKLAGKLPDIKLFIPVKFQSTASSENIPSTSFFNSGEFTALVGSNWDKYGAHIFIMATGIVVRKIATLLKDKTIDPAVVVCDEKGNFAISLLSGHIGGANRLAEKVAEIIKGEAVITTATDIQGLTAFDEIATIKGWKIKNPENIKFLNTMLLEAKKIAVILPEEIYCKYYANRKNIFLLETVANLKKGEYEGAVIHGLTDNALKIDFPVLYLQ